jgi:hypothetical protein
VLHRCWAAFHLAQPTAQLLQDKNTKVVIIYYDNVVSKRELSLRAQQRSSVLHHCWASFHLALPKVLLFEDRALKLVNYSILLVNYLEYFVKYFLYLD